MKQLMLGNEAVARGVYEAGCELVFSYPGTPSTEITEYVAGYDDIKAEWSTNEKVALEAAIGASMAGARAFCAMKHVGLNVASDPLFTAAYTGVTGGLVLAVADDPGMHSSQNEQDTRSVAIAAKIPVLEPVDSSECLELTKAAFEISEKFDIPVIIRLTTRVSHTRSPVEPGEKKIPVLKEYVKNPSKNVMVPANARERRRDLDRRMKSILDFAETGGINITENSDGNTGIIACGVGCLYAREGAPDNSGLLRLRMTNPIAERMIKDFASGYKRIVVFEELDPVVENHCRTLGIEVTGKQVFPEYGEYSQALAAKELCSECTEFTAFGEGLPLRPPVLCAGCPHRGVFYVLKKLGLYVSGDIGCYTLGAAPPLSAIDSTICMGASISGLHGYLKARPDHSGRAAAVIGDSTFLHSGITGLINTVYNQSDSTIIILDNSTTGMTGHQHHPATGYDIRGDAAPKIDLAGLCRACGVRRVEVCDPYDLANSERVIRKELEAEEPSVIIMQRPCVLLKTFEKQKPLTVDSEKCVGCKICLSLGCPAISFTKERAAVETSGCVGCGICARICPVKAIAGGEEV